MAYIESSMACGLLKKKKEEEKKKKEKKSSTWTKAKRTTTQKSAKLRCRERKREYLTHGQDHVGCNVGVLEKLKCHKSIILTCFGVFQDVG
jgi:hypothetical protein